MSTSKLYFGISLICFFVIIQTNLFAQESHRTTYIDKKEYLDIKIGTITIDEIRKLKPIRSSVEEYFGVVKREQQDEYETTYYFENSPYTLSFLKDCNCIVRIEINDQSRAITIKGKQIKVGDSLNDIMIKIPESMFIELKSDSYSSSEPAEITRFIAYNYKSNNEDAINLTFNWKKELVQILYFVTP